MKKGEGQGDGPVLPGKGGYDIGGTVRSNREFEEKPGIRAKVGKQRPAKELKFTCQQ